MTDVDELEVAVWIAVQRGLLPLWTPHPDNHPQCAACNSSADELLYGGAAGGGKSDLLLGLALTQHQRSIIFRRQYPQLEALITRSRELLPYDTGAKFNASRNVWLAIPPHGRSSRRLEFGALQYEEDVQKYQGRPHDLKAFDELTHFSRAQYMAMSRGWLRSTMPGQRLRIVGASNPPLTDEGRWVEEHWAPWVSDRHPKPAADGEVRWYALVGDEEVMLDPDVALGSDGRPAPVIGDKGELIYPMSRTFISARLGDNPYYAGNSAYLTALQALPEPIRSQLLHGDWRAGTEDSPNQVIPTKWILEAQARWAARREEMQRAPITAIGVDVARGGGDQTVVAPLRQDWMDELTKRPGKATLTGDSVVILIVPLGAEPGTRVSVDAIGVGSAVVDAMRKTKLAGGVRAINFGAGTSKTDRSGLFPLRNVRAAAWWGTREALDPAQGATLALPPDPELLADLVSARYKVVTGKIIVEEKAEIIKRLGRSPDCGDAAVLALYDGGGLTMEEYLAARDRESRGDGQGE